MTSAPLDPIQFRSRLHNLFLEYYSTSNFCMLFLLPEAAVCPLGSVNLVLKAEVSMEMFAAGTLTV
jgi:hypothetical protein